MTDKEWQDFFVLCARTLGEGYEDPFDSNNWCSWTTFERLQQDAGYWMSGLPRLSEINETYISDGGVWGQPFSYSEIAHIILPSRFYWEHATDGLFETGTKEQNIEKVSMELTRMSIKHRKTGLMLEIKLY